VDILHDDGYDSGMAKKNTGASGDAKRYPSRDKFKYVAVPVEFWDVLNVIGQEEERSVAYMVKVAVREWLEKRGRLPE